MKTFNEFLETVKDQIRQTLPEAEVKLQKINKLQGESYVGISVQPEGAAAAVTFNVDSAYKQYQADESKEGAILDKLAADAKRAASSIPTFELSDITDYEKVKEHLMMQVVPAERNKEMLADIPHKEIEDIAVVEEADMRPSFVNLPKPFLVDVITDTNPSDALVTLRNAEYAGAQAFDLHLSVLDPKYHNEKDLESIIKATSRPVMLINYRGSANLAGTASDEERMESNLKGIRAGASAVDIMGDFFDPQPLQVSHKPEIVDKQKRLIDQVHSMGAEVIMSSHTFNVHHKPEQAVEHLAALQERGADMVKLAETLNSEDDLLEAFQTTVMLKRELNVPFIHICMGQWGKLHRFVGPMLGSSLIFCVEQYTPNGHKEQPLLRAAKAVLSNLDWSVARSATEGLTFRE